MARAVIELFGVLTGFLLNPKQHAHPIYKNQPEKNMSHVAMQTLVCPVCGKEHHHNAAILLHKQLKDIKPENTYGGFGLCEKDEGLFMDGYIALIAAIPHHEGDTLKMEDASRTGKICHLHRTVFNNMFDTEVSRETPFVFIEPDALDLLEEKAKSANEYEKE